MQYRVTTETTDLRIREEPSTNSRIIGGLPRGRVVAVVEVRDNRPVGKWMKLEIGGWAYAGDQGQFLTLVPPGSAPGAAAVAPPSPASHILLFFGGFLPEGRPGGDVTRPDGHGDTRTSAQAYDAISGQFAAHHAWDPELTDAGTAAVTVGLNFLRQWRSLQGKLVIYGFSAGAFNALRLCERMAGDPVMGRRRVDLLITVDPCLQDVPGHRGFRRSAPRPFVVKHVNYYQTVGQRDDGYIGSSTPGANEEREMTPSPPPPRDALHILRTAPARRHLSAHDQMPKLSLGKVREALSTLFRELPAKALHLLP